MSDLNDRQLSLLYMLAQSTDQKTYLGTREVHNFDSTARITSTLRALQRLRDRGLVVAKQKGKDHPSQNRYQWRISARGRKVAS